MIKPKRYLVYYRDIPAGLDNFLLKDRFMSFTKDGVQKYGTHRCPRATIVVSPAGQDVADQYRCKRLESLLTELAKNNQIVGWT